MSGSRGRRSSFDENAEPEHRRSSRERARRHPDRPAIVEYRRQRTQRVTFGVAERTAALAAGLCERGVGPGDHVLLFVPMSIDLYTALLACFHLGAAAVFVDAWADRQRLDAAVALARPKAFIGTPKAHLLRLMSPAVRRIRIRIMAGSPPLSLQRYARPKARAVPVEVPAAAPALIALRPAAPESQRRRPARTRSSGPDMKCWPNTSASRRWRSTCRRCRFSS